MLDTNGIQQNLQGVDAHLDDILVLSSKLEYVDDLVDDGVLEALVLAKLVLEDDLNNSDELHQQTLLVQGQLLVIFLEREQVLKSLEEANREVRRLNILVFLELLVYKVQGSNNAILLLLSVFVLGLRLDEF